MKLKHIMLSLLASTALLASAQHQGYQDGIEYFKADQFDNAKEILTNTLNDPSTNRAEALYYLGEIALKEGDVATARKNFEEGAALDPKNGYNFVGLGSLALKAGDPKAAADLFKQATKAQNKAFINVAVARAYYNADPVAYAKEYDKYMENAVKKDKKDPSIYVMRGDVLRDRALSAGSDEGQSLIGEAATEYSQAIYFNPQSPEAYVKYSRVYAKANPAYAIDKLKELNEIAPNSALAQRELAERYYDNDQWTRAAQQYGKYIENPNHFVKDEERYAVLLYFGENYDKSLEMTRQGLAKDPNSLQLKRMMMLNLYKKGDLAGAKAAADEYFAQQKTPNLNDYTTLADIQHDMGDNDGELQTRLKAAEANPEKPELYKDLSLAFSQAASKANKAGDTEAANKNYVEAAAAMQKYVDAGDATLNERITLAQRYQNAGTTSPEGSAERQEYYGKALEAINHVIEKAEDAPEPYQVKARLTMLMNDGKADQSTVDAYAKMIEILNKDPEARTRDLKMYNEAYTYMASYYIANGDNATAKDLYLKMLDLDPENEALRAYIDKMK